MNFRKFLGSLRPILHSGQCNRFVLGNSGADYDSVIGSLIYAFYLTTSLKITHLPLIDCSEQDLKLRFQVMTVFDDLQISKSDLLYTDMVKNLYGPNNTFALYDHNIRPEINNDKIFEIIDHHAYQPSKIKCQNIISHCGSALTLLYYLYNPLGLQKFEGQELHTKFMKYLKNGKENKEIPQIEDVETINQLLYGGIMIDSYGLNKNQAQVWNQFDRNAVKQLESKINPRFNFDQLASSKFDRQKNLILSLQQHRKKDYKCLSYDGFVVHYYTILLDIRLFLDAYWQHIAKEMPVGEIGQNQIYAFMFSFPNNGLTDIVEGNFKKFILFTASNAGLIYKWESLLTELNFLKLQDKENWKIWQDPTGKISRKIFDKELRSKL